MAIIHTVLGGVDVDHTAFMVVDDSVGNADIPADVVIGQPCIADCVYPLVDTKHLRLLSTDTVSCIQLQPVIRVADNVNGVIKRRVDVSSSQHTSAHVINMIDTGAYTITTIQDDAEQQLIKLVFPRPGISDHSDTPNIDLMMPTLDADVRTHTYT